jgi:uncharacterized membrane protein YdbT with pleckstrin-like domain
LTTEGREFKPRRSPFIIPRIVAALVIIAVLSVGLAVAALVVDALLLLGLIPVLWLGIGLPSLYGAHVAYTKERYEIHGDHLVCHRGSILSDGRTELDIHNITHVRLRLPWLRHQLFGIGDVRVESAGSSASEITFAAIDGPENVFKEVQDLMRDNGYSLQMRETLHEESPGVVGALTSAAQVGGRGIFSVVILIGMMGGIAADVGPPSATGLIGVLGGGAVLVALLLSVGALVVRYLDMTRRTYTVYDDAVAYTEGFLTRDNAVIPFENIADASTTRTVVDQVLGLYDVKVSCQGSGSEILFRRLSRGEQLKTAIGELVANASKKSREVVAAPTPPPDADSVEAPNGAPEKRPALPTKKLVDPDDAWTAELQMNVVRAQIPLLVLVPVLPAWLLAAGGMFIRSTKTTFTIGPNSMSSSYAFLGATQQEFAYDKVTGVQVNRSPIDEMFDTLSVQIWSIGSPKPLNMQYISADALDLPALLRQCGINTDNPAQGELEQSFGPKVWLIQNAFVLLTLGVLALGLLFATLFAGPLALVMIPFVLALPLPMAIATSMRVKRQRITFHPEHVEAQTGIIFRKHIYARYDNVKKVESTQIPFTDQGRFKLYVAGEQVVQQQNGQAKSKIPYSLQGAYIEGISLKTDAMDALMLGVIEPSEIGGRHAQDDDVISVSKPAVANAVVVLALVGLFFPPLWLLLPIVAWQTKVRSYSVETDRVVERGGIFFKYATSVLFGRIDSLQQHQGALGKAFGNGQVTILTAGSSAPDLNVANIPDYQEVYATIREHYGS